MLVGSLNYHIPVVYVFKNTRIRQNHVKFVLVSLARPLILLKTWARVSPTSRFLVKYLILKTYHNSGNKNCNCIDLKLRAGKWNMVTPKKLRCLFMVSQLTFNFKPHSDSSESRIRKDHTKHEFSHLPTALNLKQIWRILNENPYLTHI